MVPLLLWYLIDEAIRLLRGSNRWFPLHPPVLLIAFKWLCSGSFFSYILLRMAPLSHRTARMALSANWDHVHFTHTAKSSPHSSQIMGRAQLQRKTVPHESPHTFLRGPPLKASGQPCYHLEHQLRQQQRWTRSFLCTKHNGREEPPQLASYSGRTEASVESFRALRSCKNAQRNERAAYIS